MNNDEKVTPFEAYQLQNKKLQEYLKNSSKQNYRSGSTGNPVLEVKSKRQLSPEEEGKKFVSIMSYEYNIEDMRKEQEPFSFRQVFMNKKMSAQPLQTNKFKNSLKTTNQDLESEIYLEDQPKEIDQKHFKSRDSNNLTVIIKNLKFNIGNAKA
eukprot:CAMPEP_0170561904 /NCGR_PEP_ID=MMETSP0211-20121228/57691_1 /TAXON_ID=311385 /ORGANISM="Pseudokeronopsis sp., Strain OXSARD2" /LENGTH=153 /DNA_ID=CAMNT_0010878077 /DNA_START=60 /DNA_END=521 /DNA_ORIENTATION=+